MFINDRLIYLQMHKTGCTHIARLLKEHVGGEKRTTHSLLTFDKGERTVIGSVRNPWDWYVSLWAYGCSGRGALRHLLTSPFISLKQVKAAAAGFPGAPVDAAAHALGQLGRSPMRHRSWEATYGDPNDVARFRSWLKRVMSPEGKLDLGEGFALSSIRSFAGLFTYRFVKLNSDYRQWPKGTRSVKSQDDLERYWEEASVLDVCIRNEQLHQDLEKALVVAGYDLEEVGLPEDYRRNKSDHRPTEEYYDDETDALIREQESFLIRHFDYSSPLEQTLPTSGRLS
jgi:hypothetical protein